VNRFGGARLPLSDDDRKVYRKTQRVIGAAAARAAMGLPAPSIQTPADPLLAPIFTVGVPAVSKKAGISPQSINEWRRSENPRLRSLVAALRACGFRLALVPIYEDAAE
jgi:hypothetical protein